MHNVSLFIKENIPVCVGTLGLAIIGYLGYHLVRWIIDKCQKCAKIEQVAKKNIDNQQGSSTSSKSLVNRIIDVEISPDKITIGQGEYIVFHQLPNGQKLSLSPETFEKVYEILLKFSPGVLVSNGSGKESEEVANRYELIKAKLQEIDPTLRAMFIPRTLYELIFVRQYVQENLKNVSSNKDSTEKGLIEINLNRKKNSWNPCRITSDYRSSFRGNDTDEYGSVREIAYRLNEVFVKNFSLSQDGFTYQEFASLVEQEISFFKEDRKSASNCSIGIHNESEAQIVRNAVALDCSKIAQHSFLLYRGSDFEKDSPCRNFKVYQRKTHSVITQEEPFSLSYGTGLFAGCINDGGIAGANAFYYMCSKANAYALSVPFAHFQDSPFFIPVTHTVAQLLGGGSFFIAEQKFGMNSRGES